MGQNLLVITNVSAHLLEPTCGDVEPEAFVPWPVPDADEHRPEPGGDCGLLPECLAWSEPTVPGDINRDGCVDGGDWDIATGCFGETTDPCMESILADLDGNGIVDDYIAVLPLMGNGCESGT